MQVRKDFWTSGSKVDLVNLHKVNIDYTNLVDKLQTYIADNSTQLYDNIQGDMTHDERRKILRHYIAEYLRNFKPVVSEYIGADGRMNYSMLEAKLIDDITNYDILTDAMTNDDVNEIRINNGILPGGIWVEKGGEVIPPNRPNK